MCYHNSPRALDNLLRLTRIGSTTYCCVMLIKQVSYNISHNDPVLKVLQVVSASSDGAVRAWSPHLSHAIDPVLLGVHEDYARCLAVRFVDFLSYIE